MRRLFRWCMIPPSLLIHPGYPPDLRMIKMLRMNRTSTVPPQPEHNLTPLQPPHLSPTAQAAGTVGSGIDLNASPRASAF